MLIPGSCSLDGFGKLSIRRIELVSGSSLTLVELCSGLPDKPMREKYMHTLFASENLTADPFDGTY